MVGFVLGLGLAYLLFQPIVDHIDERHRVYLEVRELVSTNPVSSPHLMEQLRALGRKNSALAYLAHFHASQAMNGYRNGVSESEYDVLMEAFSALDDFELLSLLEAHGEVLLGFVPDNVSLIDQCRSRLATRHDSGIKRFYHARDRGSCMAELNQMTRAG